MRHFDLTGHVGLVTGGNSGIGLGLCRGLLRAGAKVALWGRDEAKNRAAVEELTPLGEVRGFRVDVTDELSVMDGVQQTLSHFARIDSCFANAGFGEPHSFLETSLLDFERIVRGNLTSTFLTLREAAKHMVARGDGGKLIALSSIGGLDHGMPGQEAYSCTKAAACAMVRSLAVELARYNIQANAIVPGWIETPATEAAIADAKLFKAIVQRTPARRWGTPRDFEGAAVFLASHASDFMTGEILRIDGGYTKY